MFEALAKEFKKVAMEKDIAVVWGGDWKWKDLPHFQI